MIVKNEIEIHQNSVDYVRETISKYEIANETLNKVENPILHLYPVEDTYDKDGELLGYTDSLFMRVDVYDTKSMLLWKRSKTT